ncbi:hypothetical protein [Myroides odoratimimus]|uniref:hypothetical protein n=1 Tax=Myroides odoratimimus TaxID=76832 RepID=UPI0031012800
MSIKIKYNSRRLIVLWFILSLFMSIGILAQQSQTTKGTQISDGTVFNAVEAPLDFSILELNSNKKGFLLPRMNTAQRNNIPLNSIQPGLMIFNTDEDCMEFYSSSRKLWLSLCGDENAPAEFDITVANCRDITIAGEYTVKHSLNPKANIISIRVNVSVPGTYEIEADAYHTSDNRKNGYTFYSKGRFPTAGVYNVILKGTGTPVKGYADGLEGDRIQFLFNGKKASCVVNNFVNLEGPSFTFTINQVGKVYQGVDITGNETILEASLTNIKSGGKVEITSTSVNGMSFKASRVLTNAEVTSGRATLKLKASGGSNAPIITPIVFRSNTLDEYGRVKSITKDVAIEKVNLAFLCDHQYFSFSVNGDWELNKPFSPYHTINLPILVTAPGRGVFKIRSTAAEGRNAVVFTSEVVDLKFNASQANMMYVVLKPEVGTDLPSVSGENKLIVTFESKGAREYGAQYPIENISMYEYNCPEYVVNVKGKAEFNFSGSSLKFWSHFISKTTSIYYLPPKSDMTIGTNNKRSGLTLTVNVTSPGEYDFSTNEINGIKFTAKGVVDNVGVQNISLVPEGKSMSDMPTQTFTLFNEGQPTNLRANVDFVYQPMVVYTFGAMAWHPGGTHKFTWGGGPTLLRNSRHFGWNGVVRVDGITFKQAGPVMDDVDSSSENATDRLLSNSNTFSASNLSDVDVIIIGGKHSGTNKMDITSSNLQGLANYVKNKGGAVIYGESDADQLNNFLSYLGEYGNSVKSMGANQNGDNVVSYIYNPAIAEGHNYNLILAGKFGQSVGGKLIGPHNNNKLGITVNTQSFTSLAGSNTSAFAVIRNKGGLVIVGNNNFMGGRINGSTSYGTYPTVSSSNRGPAVGMSRDRKNVYNSWFLLNLVHWSIDYAQEQKTSKY